jgi:hypothetical protein
MKKAFWIIVIGSALVFANRAEVGIIQFGLNGSLSWTNATANASYRVEAATNFSGPWIEVTNVNGSAATVAVQLNGALNLTNEFFRVVWTNPPPAQVLGEWIYEGFDPNGQLAVTGLVTFAQSSPIAGTAAFTSLGAQFKHPKGSGSFNNGTTISANRIGIDLPMAQSFSLTGQMVLDEFAGTWTYLSFTISFSGESQIIRYTGRFSARRKQ